MQTMSYLTRADPETGEKTPHEGKRKIFVSYKHADETNLPLCRQLAAYILDQYDVAVWYDSQLAAGEEYDKEIQKAIQASDAFVLLLTPTVLTSEYILEKEIPTAQNNHVSILPVIAGIAQEELPKVEDLIGHIHMPLWFFGPKESAPPFPNESLQQFFTGLKLCIANKDLLEQAKLFCERGGHALSLRHLTFEQTFVKAYGCLFGISDLGDKHLGEKLLESILMSYGTDPEFKSLQKEVAIELLTHFYRSNQPDLFFSCFRLAAEKNVEGSPPETLGHLFNGSSKWIQSIYDILFSVYKTQWHPHLLCQESDLSFLLFRQCFRINFGKEWNAEEILSQIEKEPPTALAEYETVAEHEGIGTLCFHGHTAFFRPSDAGSAADLVLDGRRLLNRSVSAGYGDVETLYLAYDATHRLLLVLHSDFDHYGSETCTQCTALRLDEDGIRSVSFSSDWIKFRRNLPYDPYTFRSRN